ncbi:MAG: SMC-Scp complex subunit ScpB [Bacillota bacterium]|nr:SMC-Scp complex subunit ScpB [Bacillota bacterium]
MEKSEQKKVIEAYLFLSEEPIKTDKVALILTVSAEEAEQLIIELKNDLKTSNRGLQIFETAGGFQLGTIPELAPYMEKAFSEDVSSNLSNAALEALAIIAYKQPVTRIEIESIRGVRSEHVLENLLKRRLIRISGRKEGPGRPLLYCTTIDFLKYFGLKELNELPPLEIDKPCDDNDHKTETVIQSEAQIEAE